MLGSISPVSCTSGFSYRVLLCQFCLIRTISWIDHDDLNLVDILGCYNSHIQYPVSQNVERLYVMTEPVQSTMHENRSEKRLINQDLSAQGTF